MKVAKKLIIILFLLVLVIFVRSSESQNEYNLNDTYYKFSDVPKATVSFVTVDDENNITHVYQYYYDDNYVIKVPYTPICTANASESFRRCELKAELEYKGKIKKNYVTSDWDVKFSTTNPDDIKLKVNDELIEQLISSSNQKMEEGKYDITLSFQYPYDAGEKFNITIMGILIDPEVGACTTIVAGGTYLLNTSISNSVTSKCITIGSDDVIFDCQGFTIDSNNFADNGIYVNQSSNNVSIRNCVLEDWDTNSIYVQSNTGDTQDLIFVNNVTIIDSKDTGIYFFFVHNSSITNSSIETTGVLDKALNLLSADYLKCENLVINATSNSKGIYMSASESVDFNNINITATYWDIEMLANVDQDCLNTFTNVLGNGGKPVAYFGSSYDGLTIRDYNNNFSQLLTCGVDGLTIINFTYDGGAGEDRGIYIVHSDNLAILDSNFTRGADLMFMSYADYFDLNNSYVSFADRAAIKLSNSNYAEFINNTLYNNDDQFIWIYSNNDYGIIRNNNFYNLGVVAASHFVDISSSTSDYWSVYNNIFNGTGDLIDTYDANSGTFNTSKQTGTRVIGNGTYIGGNAIFNDTTNLSNSYYYTCIDADTDGFCDSSFDDINDGNYDTDYLPLSDEYVAPIGDDCDCTGSADCYINEDCVIDTNTNMNRYAVYPNSSLIRLNASFINFSVFEMGSDAVFQLEINTQLN